MANPFLKWRKGDGNCQPGDDVRWTIQQLRTTPVRHIKSYRRAVALFGSVARLRCGLEGLRLKLAIPLQHDFNLAFGFLQLLAAGTGELHAFVEELQCLVQGDISLLQFGNDLFQPLEALFKFGQAQDPVSIVAQILAQIGRAEHENLCRSLGLKKGGGCSASASGAKYDSPWFQPWVA